MSIENYAVTSDSYYNRYIIGIIIGLDTVCTD